MPTTGRLSNRAVCNTLIAYAITAIIVMLAFTQQGQPSEMMSLLRIVIGVLLLPVLIKFLIQLAVSPFSGVVDWLRTRRFPVQSTPSVTVLIPAWNEEVGIIRTIESVLATHYPGLEVIVINDGSTDNTHSLITDFLAGQPASGEARVRYLPLENGGKANALNQALPLASGEIIITIDADSLMHPKAIENLVRPFADPEVAAAAGNVAIGNRYAGLGLIQQLEYLCGFFMKRADSVFNAVYIIGGAAAAYRTDILRQEGGFDHSIITEDIELSTRLLARGYKCRYAPNAIIYTEGPSDLKGLCNQRLRWKYGRFQTFYKHRSLFFNSSQSRNRYLSWLLLPTALYAEILLFLELPLLTAFFAYVAITGDYLSLGLAICLISLLISFQASYDYQPRYHQRLLLFAPVAWLIWYLVDAVEFQALIRSIKRLIRNEELKWQTWVRKGIDG
ncbi:glycosyltransferase [Neptuniibacter halophilus]|uniref:glycosyltransferase n=1 Tax=Neptuniibacter halophilus TaxID=651666 RepID=UPI002572AE6A|nr:glycosyltransferase [Neptuniibacter halophilus]